MTDKPEALEAWVYTWPGGGISSVYANRLDAKFVDDTGMTETRLVPEAQPDASALVEAAKGAAKNAEVRRVGVLLHATDWLALMEALTAWEQSNAD